MEFKDKMDIIASIICNAQGSTGTNFESKLHLILRRYYKHNGKDFLTHRSGGGEKGNDGWIKDDGLFYQIYAPPVGGSKKNIHKKYSENLATLLDAVVNKGKYGGFINEYIFIVNTIDTGLPQDEDGFINKTTKELCEKYNIKIKHGLHNLDYIKDLLETMDDEETLLSIAYDIKAPVLNGIDKYELQVSDILEFLEKLLEKTDGSSDFISDNFERIPLAYKIEINRLQSIKDEIIIVHSKLSVVEEAKRIFNDPVPRIGSVIACYVKIYKEAVLKSITSIDIYSYIIRDLMKLLDGKYETHIEYLLVYIIDKCEIFEKE